MFSSARAFFAALAASCLLSTAQAQDNQRILPTIDVTSSRIDQGIPGASTIVITAEEIARSPGESLQAIISRAAGVQTWSTFGAVNGTGTIIDMRGFGAAAASNTLVLINGRRLTDIDLGGVDFSAIPRDSIERIEITRGNSGAVLYGDGAVGGTINVVTKSGVNIPPSVKAEGGFGAFKWREGNVSANGAHGPFAVAIFGNAIDSDGYRVNNALKQRNIVGDFRYTGDQGTYYANVSVDDQKLGLPGARHVTLTSSELDTDRQGATTPTAFANKQGINATFGVTRQINNWFELIVDGGVRNKKQQVFSSLSGFDTSDDRELTTISFTPRFVATNDFIGMPAKAIGGIDYYDASLRVNRGAMLSDPPIHAYTLKQRSIGGYIQQTVYPVPSTDISFGARLQQTSVSARDTFDPNAPGAFIFDAQGTPLDTTDVQHALHFGVEHRFNGHFAMFGRLARSFRTPNVDERIGVAVFPVDFNLKSQTSRDSEIGGRWHFGPLDFQTSVYDMWLKDEIHFLPTVFANINLDPTHRYGSESSATLRVSDSLTLKVGLAYTRALFSDGPFKGHDVPLVSRWTANAGVSWNVWRKYVVMDAVVRYVGTRRMDNDQANFQPLISAFATVDMRLGGEVDRMFWSVAVQNLFNEKYFDYAVASTSTFGTYNAYPQPGVSYVARLGMKLP